MVGARVKVTRGTCAPAVAANLRVPEQRFPERDERLLIDDVLAQVCRLRDRRAFERGDGIVPAAITAATALCAHGR
jgi:hypothetical protein